VFEHRNYLPSLFVFVPVAAGVQRVLDRYRDQKHLFFHLGTAFVALLLIGLGAATYIRNLAWATEGSLWTDAHRKAPALARPLNNLAWGYYEKIGDYRTALLLYQKALTLRAHRKFHRAFSYNNMANIYYRIGDFKTAEGYWKKAIEERPDADVYRYRMATVNFKQRQWETARLNLDKVLGKHPRYFDALNLKGIVLLHEKKPVDALQAFKKCLELHPQPLQGVIYAGVALAILHQYPRAELYFKTAHQHRPDDPMILLRLIDMNLKTGDEAEVERFQHQLFAATTMRDITNKLMVLAGEPYYDEGIYEELNQHLSRAIEQQSAGIKQDE
jgi:tetratricopeptide (TPR) repeat protein